ncbi:MAG: DNA cytosine methyltransferase [Caldilineaceae bacterium SB0662_bin_9]|uniref:Cytosine-specific methyltransferase n=1 Tax=Caldilineaceae bacterium SB0662_bin_9 TaxID=2605258 RepID=A0A6B1DMM2_9CHLR|nr:DNA cytosine methyltransferase [Caldilineaceae bacterium SB0662_bin_9]
MPTAVSLFTGCGGSDQGLINAGCNIILANDKHRYAQEVYTANLPTTEYILDDITNIRKFPHADILAGCYPCQGFSQGGARKPDRPINELYKQFGRALRAIKPKAFIVENVPGMARKNNKHLLQSQLTNFMQAGYQVINPKILNGIDYGLPQERKRIFIVGIRVDFAVDYSYPQPTHGTSPHLLPITTQADTIGHTDGTWPSGEFYDLDFHWYYLSRNRHRDWTSPSKTVLANPRHMPLHPMSPPMTKICHNVWQFDGDAEDARRLSYKEAAALQDLADWDFPPTASLSTKYKVIGNAVPPILFQRVVEALPQEVLNA